MRDAADLIAHPTPDATRLHNNIDYTGVDPGFLKGGGGSIIGLQASKRGGGRRGSNFRPNVKKPTM